MTRRTVTPLNEGWHFKQTSQDASEYLPVAQFPTNVHLDLMHHKLIPDPNMGKNEQEVQWVGETSWTYKTTFTSPALSDGAKAVLVFDGLDTFATVELNGKEVLSTDNMFIQESVDVSKAISGEGKTNDLVIHFDSAFFRGHELVKANPDHKWGCWNGDNSRLPVRKAQYHWVSSSRLCIVLWTRLGTDRNTVGLGLGPYAHDMWSLAPHPPRGL